MRVQSFFYAVLLSPILPVFTGAFEHGRSSPRHNALAKSKRTDSGLSQYHKRDPNARATWYQVGLGACGKYNNPSDFIVALNTCEWGPVPYPGIHCFAPITIEHEGKQAQATIMDECDGCPCGGIDMSTGLFQFFAPLSAGVLTVNWWYDNGDGGGAPPPQHAPQPQPTSTWIPPAPKSSWTPQSASQTSSWSSTSASIWTSSSSSSSSTRTSSHASVATSSPATATPLGGTTSAPQNLEALNLLVLQLGHLVLQPTGH